MTLAGCAVTFIIGAATGRLFEPRRPDRDGVSQAHPEAPHAACAIWLREQNPAFALELLGAIPGHYGFLNEATGLGNSAAPEICLNPPGVDRRAIHDRAAVFADAHFSTALEAAA